MTHNFRLLHSLTNFQHTIIFLSRIDTPISKTIYLFRLTRDEYTQRKTISSNLHLFCTGRILILTFCKCSFYLFAYHSLESVSTALITGNIFGEYLIESPEHFSETDPVCDFKILSAISNILIVVVSNSVSSRKWHRAKLLSSSLKCVS